MEFPLFKRKYKNEKSEIVCETFLQYGEKLVKPCKFLGYVWSRKLTDQTFPSEITLIRGDLVFEFRKIPYRIGKEIASPLKLKQEEVFRDLSFGKLESGYLTEIKEPYEPKLTTRDFGSGRVGVAGISPNGSFFAKIYNSVEDIIEWEKGWYSSRIIAQGTASQVASRRGYDLTEKWEFMEKSA